MARRSRSSTSEPARCRDRRAPTGPAECAGAGPSAPSAESESAESESESAESVSEREQGGKLVSTIEAQIVPRLMLAHADSTAEGRSLAERDAGAAARVPPTADEIDRCAQLAAEQDVGALVELVEQTLREGLALDAILIDLLGAAAHRLGELWTEDEYSFTDVTIGLGSIQRVVAVLGHDAERPLTQRGLVVLSTAPGEQHTLAIHMLGEMVRKAGWASYVDPTLDETDLVDLVANEPVVLVGLTVKDLELLVPLGRVIAEMKRASLRPDLTVMLGGAPELAEYAPDLGAIHCARATDALDWLERRAERPSAAVAGLGRQG